jgi:hypothetical protein
MAAVLEGSPSVSSRVVDATRSFYEAPSLKVPTLQRKTARNLEGEVTCPLEPLALRDRGLSPVHSQVLSLAVVTSPA